MCAAGVLGCHGACKWAPIGRGTPRATHHPRLTRIPLGGIAPEARYELLGSCSQEVNVKGIALITVWVLVFACGADADELGTLTTRIDSLQQLRQQLEAELTDVVATLAELQLQRSRILAGSAAGEAETSVETPDAVLLAAPRDDAAELATLPQGTQVVILDFVMPIYWKVLHDTLVGYVGDVSLERTPWMTELKSQRLKEYAGSSAPRSKPAGSPSTPLRLPAQGTVSLNAYNRVQSGMTYRQACQIIGFWGTELSNVDLAGYRTVMYMWQNPDGSNMNASFQNGKLVTKAQFGLR